MRAESYINLVRFTGPGGRHQFLGSDCHRVDLRKRQLTRPRWQMPFPPTFLQR